MPVEFWFIAAFGLLVIAWVLAKVVFYARKSEDQWRNVDKTKLRQWEDDEW